MSADMMKKHTLYKSLFKDSGSIMMIIDPETGMIFDANRSAQAFYQYSKKEMLGMNISKINTLSEKEIKKEMEDAKLCNRNYFNFRHILKNGEIKDVEVYTGPIEFKNKNVLYSIIHDISEKKLAENALKKSESTIRAMINSTSSLVYLFDTKMNIINLNNPGALLFNKSPLEMIGKHFKLFFNENDFSKLKLLVNEVAQTHEPIKYQKDRNGRYYDVNLYPVFNDSNHVDRICVFANDITDLKKTENVFAAIETAGGICHEMNQPLQVILGNLELLKLAVKADDPNIKLINTIVLQTQKLGTITKKLANITQYETKAYVKGTIFDIDRSSGIK
ncbi:MAG: PAS domain S-box protein [Proteobacteria bacterium]|nr:PAS domain S-box protein [Pseudomonadota bacterium]MBU1584149.1 PAS domain S-box protein [Pseudomonadota bacterium]MBU2453931.1 PAS domain S-box protein [Pseudomonadota bacterium]MBU2629955.1 PAS domain S-box protein [Pseudomonadota bacterium]